MEQDIRGPKPGATAGRKRKAEHELSTNKRTIIGRLRKNNMSEWQAILERAKNADRQAVNRAFLALKKSPEYLNASSDEQDAMKEQSKQEQLQNR